MNAPQRKSPACDWSLLFAAPLCLSNCLGCHGLHWTFLYSGSVLLPRRIDLQFFYWAELSRFAMTDSRGEKKCGGKQNSALRLQNTKNNNLWTFQNPPSTGRPAPWKRTQDSLQSTITQTTHHQRAEIMFRENILQDKTSVDRQSRAKLRQPSCFYHSQNSVPLLSDSI